MKRRIKDYQKALEFAYRVRALLRARAKLESMFSRGQLARREDTSTKRIQRLEARLTKRKGRTAGAGGLDSRLRD